MNRKDQILQRLTCHKEKEFVNDYYGSVLLILKRAEVLNRSGSPLSVRQKEDHGPISSVI